MEPAVSTHPRRTPKATGWVEGYVDSAEGQVEKKEEPIGDNVLRADVMKEREAKLIRRLSQNALKGKTVTKARPLSASTSLKSVTEELKAEGESTERKPRPKSMSAATGLTMEEATEAEKKKELILLKKKKLLMLQKLKAAKIAKQQQTQESADS